MKKAIAIIALLVLTIAGGAVLVSLPASNPTLLADTGRTGDVRAVQCTVADSDGEVSVLRDETGMLWGVSDTMVCKGERYIVWLDDMNTKDNLTDDVILDYIQND